MNVADGIQRYWSLRAAREFSVMFAKDRTCVRSLENGVAKSSDPMVRAGAHAVGPPSRPTTRRQRRRRPGLVAEAPALPAATRRRPPAAGEVGRPLRRAPLPLQRKLPRRWLPSRGAGPRGDLGRLAALHGGHWLVLTGCRKGAVPRALHERGPVAATRELDRLVQAFGRDNVHVELWDHGDPLDSARNDVLVRLADRARVEVVATNNVHYATPARRRLAAALAAVRARSSLAELDGWLPAGAGAHLRAGFEQAARLARYPGTVELAAEVGRALAFDLKLVAPRLPGFPGYFLVVWDIVQLCERADIYCQGRGSAANSAVCYALGVTKADAVSLGLLFERFL